MLDDATLLLAWERGYGKPPFEQAIVLLAVCLPRATVEELMGISIGNRDATLLGLRRRLFGVRMETVTNCRQCEETLELSFAVDDIMLDTNTTDDTKQIEVDDLQIDYRLPNSRDLAALGRIQPAQRPSQLLRQCVSSVRRSDQPVEVTSLSQEVGQRIAQAISDADPQADIRLDLNCAACGHQWTSPFDIVGFLWTELNVWCQRLLAEIHTLAKAYGWSEQEILALSRWRRQVYLSMVRQ